MDVVQKFIHYQNSIYDVFGCARTYLHTDNYVNYYYVIWDRKLMHHETKFAVEADGYPLDRGNLYSDTIANYSPAIYFYENYILCHVESADSNPETLLLLDRNKCLGTNRSDILILKTS